MVGIGKGFRVKARGFQVKFQGSTARSAKTNKRARIIALILAKRPRSDNIQLIKSNINGENCATRIPGMGRQKNLAGKRYLASY